MRSHASLAFTPSITSSAFMPIAHHDNAADGLAFALPVGRATAYLRAESHGAQVAHSTGVPFCVATGTFSRSASERR